MRCKAKSSAGASLVLISMTLGFFIAVAASAEGTVAALPTRETKLTASDASNEDYFGHSVAVSGDTAIVAGGGAAYVFVRSGGVWSQKQKLMASDGSGIGGSVAVSGDTAVVGGGSAAYVFVRSNGVWNQQQRLTPSAVAGFASGFGFSVAVSGDTIAVGDPFDHGYSGSAYVFSRSGQVWSQLDKLRPPVVFFGPAPHFGSSVAIHGDTLLVGAPVDNNPAFGSGSAYVFVGDSRGWFYRTRLTASDASTFGEFGVSVAIDGGTAVIGSNSGSAYVFVGSDDVWSERQKLTPIGGAAADAFGWSVAVSGEIAVVGAPGYPLDPGSAYVFVRSTGVWTQQARLTASDGAVGDSFGRSVAVAGGSPVVGAPADSYYAAPSYGSVYVYDPALVRVWVGLKNSDDVGIRFDLLANVYLNGAAVSSGCLGSVEGGSSGFGSAKLRAIPLTLFAPVAAASGDTLSIEILARNACSGSGKNSGTARLWYGGQAIDSGSKRDAGSRLDATIGSSDSDYFLRGSFELDTAAGSVQLFVDKAAGARCSAFTSFGTWSTTLP